MKIRIGFDMTFDSAEAAPLIVLLETHPECAGAVLSPEVLHTEPPLPAERYLDPFGNRCTRMVAPHGKLRLTSDAVFGCDGQPDPQPVEAPQLSVEHLPVECLHYLLPSRYCEVDLFPERAWDLFGHTPGGWPRVTAVLDWVHANVRYGYEFASPLKTALDVFEERAGVCRDFQHLGITLCRALGIPARYASGYLADIGVPPDDTPMDFHAWFEVFLGDRWYPVDARHNTPRIGRVLMARGRDAADTALTTSFGLGELVDFRVWADELTEDAA
jgi:transglutaminase-like putative cysteine protease